MGGLRAHRSGEAGEEGPRDGVYDSAMILLLLACVHSAPPAAAGVAPPAPAAASACAAAFQDGAKVVDADPGKATAIWAANYKTCGPGYGLLAGQAYARMKAQDWDGAADLAVQEMGEAAPTQMALKVLVTVLPTVSETDRARINGLGATAETAIYVPDVDGEYAWMSLITCDRDDAKLGQQALVEGPHGELDEMTFDCPKGGHHVLYFDFSADPTEALFKEEVEAGQGAGKAP